MKYKNVYIVINEGEIAFASTDRDEAKGYAETQEYINRDEVLERWGNEDPTEENLAEAVFQAGYDNGCYDVEKVDITGLSEDDTITTQDGTEIDVSDILEKLKKN